MRYLILVFVSLALFAIAEPAQATIYYVGTTWDACAGGCVDDSDCASSAANSCATLVYWNTNRRGTVGFGDGDTLYLAPDTYGSVANANHCLLADGGGAFEGRNSDDTTANDASDVSPGKRKCSSILGRGTKQKDQIRMNIQDGIKYQLLLRNYYLAKVSYHLWFYANTHRKQPLVIYQMGKVGSTSILASLAVSNLHMPIYQVHVLSAQGIREMEKKYYGETSSVFRKSLLPETKHIFASHFLRTQLKKRLHTEKWKVITLVRDPIARNVSEFFYSIDTTKDDPHLPNFYKRYESNNIETEELLERFLERFHEKSEECQLPLRWFDTEFKSVLGIDIFSTDFPKSKGYQIVEGDHADVLILKLERIHEYCSEAFSQFLNLNEFSLVTANAARQKKYYPAFKSFMKLVDLPSGYVSKMYESKFVKHFYDDEEINFFWEKWHKRQQRYEV